MILRAECVSMSVRQTGLCIHYMSIVWRAPWHWVYQIEAVRGWVNLQSTGLFILHKVVIIEDVNDTF